MKVLKQLWDAEASRFTFAPEGAAWNGGGIGEKDGGGKEKGLVFPGAGGMLTSHETHRSRPPLLPAAVAADRHCGDVRPVVRGGSYFWGSPLFIPIAGGLAAYTAWVLFITWKTPQSP